MVSELRGMFPESYAIYDCGDRYGVAQEDNVYWVDKRSLDILDSTPHYDEKAIEILTKSIPLWFKVDDDDGQS